MRLVCRTVLPFAMAAALAACKFVDTAELEARNAAKANESGQAVADWDSQIVPHMNEAAVTIDTLRGALTSDGLEAAGTKYGHREGGEGSPFTYVAAFEGTIVEANTESRAGTASVDVDGDGKADVTLQLGPVIRGTAIRDALPFVSFTEYQNQIEFARVAKDLNAQAYERVLSTLPRDALVGSKIRGVGAVTVRGSDETFVVTPVDVSLEAAS